MTGSQTWEEASDARQDHIPGEAGLWVFIFGDMVMFAVLFATIAHYRSQDLDVFAASQQTLSKGLGVLNTILLLTSSLIVALGVQAVRRDRRQAASRCFLFGIACGVGFCIVKWFEYSSKVHSGLLPTTNNFYTCYFASTGIHLLHVIVGMVLLWVMARRARSHAPMNINFFEGAACYWHLVDLLWIVLYTLLYLAI